MIQTLLPLLLLSLIAVGCTSDDPAPKPDPAKNVSSETKSSAAMVVHDAKCGCSIEGIGRCGNYIMIDEKYVPLVHESLGKMEFCKQKDAGAKIEAAGAMKDGKFIATAWKYVQ